MPGPCSLEDACPLQDPIVSPFKDGPRSLAPGGELELPVLGGRPYPYVERAKGAHLWDVDGRRFIDYRMAFGPIILGHAYDEVDERVIRELRQGGLYAMTTELEIAVAEFIHEMVPAMEMIRFACSGTEADDARHPPGAGVHGP